MQSYCSDLPCFNNSFLGDRDDVDTEGILKPHLQRIVNQSMGLAQTAKDPAQYFTLLKHLFRAIGN